MCKSVTLDLTAQGCKILKQVDSTARARCSRNQHADRQAGPCIKLASSILALQSLAFVHDVVVHSPIKETTKHSIVSDSDARRNNVTSERFSADARVYAHMADLRVGQDCLI